VETSFTARLFQWRGPAPFFWLALTEQACEDIRAEAAAVSYGWGAVPVQATIGTTRWETSLLPRDGGFLLPVKQAVRTREHLLEDADVQVAVRVADRGGRAANGTGRAQ
jgi:hypothetical protein